MTKAKRKSNKRSTLEERVGRVLEPAGFLYEPYKIPYRIEHQYTPDFTIGNMLIEVKGWLRPGDRQKYKAVRDACQELGCDFAFVLQSPNKKVQKGAKSSISDWCDKEGIRWWSEHDLESLINHAVEAGHVDN